MQRILFQGDSITDAAETGKMIGKPAADTQRWSWGVWDMTSRASMNFSTAASAATGW